MIFLGFLIFENKLKGTTKEWITELKEGKVNCIMATGDNTKTASSVAIKWAIIDEPKYYKIDLVEEKYKFPYLKWREISYQGVSFHGNSQENYTDDEELQSFDEEDQDTDDENHPLLEDNSKFEPSKPLLGFNSFKSSNSSIENNEGFDEIMNE